MYDFFNKYKLYIIIALIITIIITILISFKILTKSKTKSNEIIIDNQEEINEEVKDEIAEIPSLNIKVDIKGEVNNPGVYLVNDEARVSDVINEAGGLTENANSKIVNLAKRVFDEMVIIIYSNEEVNDFTKVIAEEQLITEKSCTNIILDNDACIEKKDESKKININTCTLEDLMTLPGIGESKAKSIISYREENNGFKAIEEIMEVSGIKESVFVQIKDFITI